MRAGWVLAAVVLVEQAIVTSEYFALTWRSDAAVLPLLALATFGAALALMVAVPTWMAAVAYLAVGASAISGYIVLIGEAGVMPERISVVGSMGTALTLVGTARGGALAAAAWILAGQFVGQGALVATQILVGRPPIFDAPALFVGFLFLVLNLALWRHDRAQSEYMLDRKHIDAGVARDEATRKSTTRAAAIVHETILRDLALVAHGAGQLSDLERNRLRRNLDDIAAGHLVHLIEPMDVPRNDFYEIVHEFQWRGLSIDVGGNSYALELLSASDRDAMLGAMWAALDNVLAHSGKTSAEVFIDHAPDRLTLMIVDEGSGFDFDHIAEDRLGLRMSIKRRIEGHGGTATVWAAPGAGTSIVLSLPLRETETVPR